MCTGALLIIPVKGLPKTLAISEAETYTGI